MYQLWPSSKDFISVYDRIRVSLIVLGVNFVFVTCLVKFHRCYIYIYTHHFVVLILPYAVYVYYIILFPRYILYIGVLLDVVDC